VKLLAYRIFDPIKANKPSDLKPEIARQAYGLYEQQGHHEGHAVQNWLDAEKKIRKAKSDIIKKHL